jgi:hypothetical protein
MYALTVRRENRATPLLPGELHSERRDRVPDAIEEIPA